MATWKWIAFAGMAISALLLAGCTGQIVSDNGTTFTVDTAVTNSLGEANLYTNQGSETLGVRNSSTDALLSGMQVLGLSQFDHRLYVAADPQQHYHPIITSGESSNYYAARVYMSPVDQRLGTSATMYTELDNALLPAMVWHYGQRDHTVAISGLRDRLASLAYGQSSMLVVCLDKPLTASGNFSAIELAQRADNLPEALQSIGWQYLFTSHGFSSQQSVELWVIDPYDLGIAAGGSGALSNCLITVVAPTNYPVDSTTSGAMKVELTWNAAVDLDLHLTRGGADLYDTANDCYWKYMQQNWGIASRVDDDPCLLFDNRSGYGPETVMLDQMTPGEQYTVAVDYWGDAAGNPTSVPTTATVKVWTNGCDTPHIYQVTGLNSGAPETGQYKVVCDIDGSTGEVTIANRSLTRILHRGVTIKKK